MICMVKIRSRLNLNALWNEILNRKEELQEVLDVNGKILCISRQCGRNEAGLLIHVTNVAALSDFITGSLSKLAGVDAIWVVTMLKPVFFAPPADHGKTDRYAVTLEVSPAKLSETHGALASSRFLDGVNMTSLAYALHLPGACLKLSLTAADRKKLRGCVDALNRTPGVLRTTVRKIEKTVSFVSHAEWQKYISRNASTHWNRQIYG